MLVLWSIYKLVWTCIHVYSCVSYACEENWMKKDIIAGIVYFETDQDHEIESGHDNIRR